jgi:hypothetical protein
MDAKTIFFMPSIRSIAVTIRKAFASDGALDSGGEEDALYAWEDEEMIFGYGWANEPPRDCSTAVFSQHWCSER